MGRFVGTGEERKLVTKYIDSYMRGTNQYAKYLQSAPNFVTYYSRDNEASTENSGLGEVEDIVGPKSGIRYNRINNVPFYMVEDASPDLLNDGVLGLGYALEGTAIIIPDTVIPVPNDVFIFPYWENEEHKETVFRITNVTTTAVDSNTYYQIQYQTSPYLAYELEAEQIVERYEVVYDHVGSSKPAILVESDYLLAERVGEVFDKVAAAYIEDYYNEKLNLFVCEGDPGTGAPGRTSLIFDRQLHEYLRSKKFFINSKSLAKNILLQELYLSRSAKRVNPFFSPDLNLTYDLQTSSLPIIKLFPLAVQEVTYLPAEVSTVPRLDFVQDLRKLGENLEGAELDSALTEDWLPRVEAYIETSTPVLTDYLGLPVLLGVLDDLGDKLVRGGK